MCIAETSQQAVFHRAGRTCVAFLVSGCVPLCTGLCAGEKCTHNPPPPGPRLATRVLLLKVPPQSWPFWSLWPMLRVSDRSPEVHFKVGAKHIVMEERILWPKATLVCFSLVLLCVLRHPKTSVLVLVLPILLKAMGKQAGFCRIQCVSRVLAPSPFNCKVEHLSSLKQLFHLPCLSPAIPVSNKQWTIDHEPLYLQCKSCLFSDVTTCLSRH